MQEAKQQVLTELKQAVGSGFSPSIDMLEVPPDLSLGDVAFPCFVLAKKLKKNPQEIAVELAAKIGPKKLIGNVKAVGPYVNFSFTTSQFGDQVLEEIHKKEDTYGTSDVGTGKRIMVEFANLNTHKDVHIGHLRNLFLGQMLVDVLKANGYDVIPVAYINDLGAHVAKSVWAMTRFHEGEVVQKDKRIDFLREVYVEATDKAEEDPSFKQEIVDVFKNLEDQKGKEVAIWKETRKWSLEFLERVYDELGLTIENWYFESQLIDKTKKIIEDLIQKGIVVESQGAWIVNLEDQDLGANLLVKSDGTLLYNAKDLGLALKKEEDYHPLKSIYVVDARQAHALQQLFATLKRMEFDRDVSHLSYEFVALKDGAMASRKGNVIRYEDFRDALIEEASKQTASRHPDWKAKQIDEVARAVAFAGMRFGMLKQDPEKKILFDFEEALSFDGFSGPYLLYTNARISSLLKKAGKLKPSRSTKKLTSALEHRLLVLLSQYPEELFEMASTSHLSRMAQYLFELAKAFSSYYNDVQILQGEEEEMTQRLALLQAIRQVLQNGLGLMGIETVQEM